MIPLTNDLLSAILLCNEVELRFLDGSNPSQWYLAILGCKHFERRGYLLGRVCYIPPSDSGAELMYTGYLKFESRQDYERRAPDLFPLSPDTTERFRPRLALKMVYIPHPDPADLLRSVQFRPYTVVKLVLLTETRDALRSHGYKANLCDPDFDHPTTHWLTLSNDEHTIAVEFQHTLKEDGERFVIDAEVKILGSHA